MMRDPKTTGEIALAALVTALPPEYAVFRTFFGVPVEELSYKETIVLVRASEEQRLSDQMVSEVRAKIYTDARQPWWRFWR